MEFELRSICTLLVQLHQKKAHLARATTIDSRLMPSCGFDTNTITPTNNGIGNHNYHY